MEQVKIFGFGSCDSKNPCPLHAEWSVLKGHIEDWARSHNLGDSLTAEQSQTFIGSSG